MVVVVVAGLAVKISMQNRQKNTIFDPYSEEFVGRSKIEISFS